MKVLVIGADGFVGRNVYEELSMDSGIHAIPATRKSQDYRIDLLDRESIDKVLSKVRPDVVINCAGIVANTEDAWQNKDFCQNLMEEIVEDGDPYPKVIIVGSAAVYGVVEDTSKPVGEDTPLQATSNYGKSKIEEEKVIHKYADHYGVSTTVLRVFNPIGPGMGEKFLLTSLLSQIRKMRQGQQSGISLSRLDSKRDYIDVRDVAAAFHAVVTSDDLRHGVYNVGSGKPTTNGELVEQLLGIVKLDKKPDIVETQDSSEPAYASQADIDRIKSDTGWSPKYELEITLEDIVNGGA